MSFSDNKGNSKKLIKTEHAVIETMIAFCGRIPTFPNYAIH